MGKSTNKWPFSIAMLVHQRVYTQFLPIFIQVASNFRLFPCKLTSSKLTTSAMACKDKAQSRWSQRNVFSNHHWTTTKSTVKLMCFSYEKTILSLYRLRILKIWIWMDIIYHGILHRFLNGTIWWETNSNYEYLQVKIRITMKLGHAGTYHDNYTIRNSHLGNIRTYDDIWW